MPIFVKHSLQSASGCHVIRLTEQAIDPDRKIQPFDNETHTDRLHILQYTVTSKYSSVAFMHKEQYTKETESIIKGLAEGPTRVLVQDLYTCAVTLELSMMGFVMLIPQFSVFIEIMNE